MKKILKVVLFVIIVATVYTTSVYLINQNDEYKKIEDSKEKQEEVNDIMKNESDIIIPNESGEVIEETEDAEEKESGETNVLEESGDISLSGDKSNDITSSGEEIQSNGLQISGENMIEYNVSGETSGESNNI